MVAAAFTVGLVIAGQFGADLKNFEQVVESPVVTWMARALYYVLPNLAPFDVKAQFVHAQPIPSGYVALTTGYGVDCAARHRSQPDQYIVEKGKRIHDELPFCASTGEACALRYW